MNGPLPVPLLVGPYLLRRPEPGDVPWIFDACQDDEIVRWTTVPRPYLPRHAVDFVEQHHTEAARYVITLADTGELLGAIALKWYDAAEARGEIGYWLGPDARGRGVATRALDGLSDHCFRELGASELVLRIAEGNEASEAVARRAGYEATGRDIGGCRDGGCVVDAVVFTRRAG